MKINNDRNCIIINSINFVNSVINNYTEKFTEKMLSVQFIYDIYILVNRASWKKLTLIILQKTFLFHQRMNMKYNVRNCERIY